MNRRRLNLSGISVSQIRFAHSKDFPSEACHRRLSFSRLCIKKTSLKHTHLSLSNKINLRITQAAQIFINKYLEGTFIRGEERVYKNK